MSNILKVGEIEKLLNYNLQIGIAEHWDNVGLLIGNREQKVNKIIVTLDATSKVIDEALLNDVDLIVTHHPVIFNSLKSITVDNNSNIYKLIKNDISVYSAHTNFDKLDFGTSALISDIIGLISSTNLSPDGLGRIGNIPNTPKHTFYLKSFAEMLKYKFGLSHLTVIGELDNVVERVAVCAGSGSSLLEQAKGMGADTFVTGDIGYHDAQKAIELGLNMVDITHYASENVAMVNLKKAVEKTTSHKDIKVILSSTYDQPLNII